VRPLQSKSIHPGTIPDETFDPTQSQQAPPPLQLGDEAFAFSGQSGNGHVSSSELRALNIDDLLVKCKKLIEDMEIAHFGSTVRSSDEIKGKTSTAATVKPEDAPIEKMHPAKSVPNVDGLIETALRLSYGSDTYFSDNAVIHTVNDQTSDFLEMHRLPVNLQTSSDDDHADNVDSVFANDNCCMGVTLQDRAVSEGLLLPVQVICSSFRHLKYPQSKIVSLMLLVRMGLQCTDEVILHRIVPTLLLGVEDPFPPVRAMCVRALRSVLQAVRAVNAVEANIFPQYVFPALSAKVARDPEFIVRVAFAESIGRLAETAKRFLDQTHLAVQNRALAESNVVSPGTPAPSDTSSNAGGSTSGRDDSADPKNSSSVTVVDFPYDAKLKALHEQVNRWIRDLVLDSGSAYDPSQRGYTNSASTGAGGFVDPRRGSMLMQHALSAGSTVKRVLLVDVMRLCIFFGQEATMDILLRYILTFLNDSDWELRYAFCGKIASVCAFIGPAVTTEYILPCVENALADVEDRVIVKAIQCLHSLIQMGLLAKFLVVDTVTNAVPLLLNPCSSIREASICLVTTAMQRLGPIDSMVFLFPVLRSVCRYDITICKSLAESEAQFRLALRNSISRKAYRAALVERLERYDSGYGGGSSGQAAMSGLNANRETAKITSSIMHIPASTGSEDSGRVGSKSSNIQSQPDPNLTFDFGLDPSAMFSSDPDYKPVVSKSSIDSATSSSIAMAINAAMNSDITSESNGVGESLVSTSSSSAASSGIPSVGDIDDAEKLVIIKPYLDRVAQEINQKSIQQRNFLVNQASNDGYGMVVGGSGQSAGATARRRVTSMARANHFSSTDSLLDISAASMPEYSSQSLYIPHQKYGMNIFPSYSGGSGTDNKKVNISDLLAAPKSSQKLRQVFGIITSQGDMARALSAGVPDQWESQLSNFGIGDTGSVGSGGGNIPGGRQSAPVPHRRTLGMRTNTERNLNSIAGAPGNLSGGGEGGAAGMNGLQGGNVTAVSHAFGNNVGYDARALARRIRALNIPQLPSEFGSLVQPDDRKFK
jgi:hypothetical protein